MGGSRRARLGLRQNRSGRAEVDAAKAALGQLVEETTQKLDIERVRCSEYKDRQKRILEEAWQDIAALHSGAVAARAKILRAQYGLHQAQSELPKLRDSMDAHSRKCSFAHDSLQGQIQMLAGDLGALGDLGVCTDAASLLQCRHSSRRHGHHHDKVLVAFGNEVSARVRSKFTRSALQHAFQRANAARTDGDPATALLETTRQSRRLRRGRTTAGSSRRGLNTPSCTRARSADCGTMNAEFLKVQAGLIDRWEDLKEELGRSQAACEAAARSFGAQLATLQAQQRDGNVALADGTKDLNLKEGEARMKSLQVADLQRDLEKTTEACQASVDSFESELCSLRAVRVEVDKMSGGDGAFQDCAVTDWVPEACSATCGGGTQVLRRQTVSPPSSGGVGCPPLELERKCAEQPCPVDCELDSWSEWSACSAACGGGVRQRIRNPRVEPAHGGQACEETGETEGCNLEACDRECELSDWSEWSTCSKMCGGGSMARGREVMTEATGGGTCPDSDGRLEHVPCNMQNCTNATVPDAGVLCRSKLDVVLAIDGSGFRNDGDWAHVINASVQLLNRFTGGAELARVGVLLFSGPSDLATYRACTQGMGQAAPDLETQCRFTWPSRLTEDIASAAAAVAELPRPGGTALTARAVMAAMQELRGSRHGAESVIVVLTDGAPMSSRAMGQVASKVRGTARLMWVPVSSRAPLEQIRAWASRPVEENVLPAADAAALQEAPAITRIVSNICPKLSGIVQG
mmetsp:Transcript_100786/g.285357  ORF Transcript_100786/g.285357 Transcript_100786/m.285357 type:complete len:749 (-) Transcript_100786:95-2341(-)